MIRVNLLPIRQARRRTAGKTQLVVFVALIVLEVLVLAMLWGIASSDLSRVQAQVKQYEAEVAQAKAEVQDAKQLEEQKKQLERQLQVLDDLEAARSGPVRVLDELQAMMSPPRNEEDRFAQLQKNWNVDWDPRRLWIDSLDEAGGKFSMSGRAVSADDVAEFLQRLTTADHFTNVQLEVVQSEGKKDTGSLVKFSLHGQVVYAGQTSTSGDGT